MGAAPENLPDGRSTDTEAIIGPAARTMPRYGGLTTYAHLPTRDQVTRLDVAVAGVPFDAGVTYRPGARFGPNHIRQSSRILRPYNPALETMPFAAHQVADVGDIAATPFSITDAIDAIHAGVRELTDAGALPLLLGGDHTIALPALRALHAVHGPLTVLHFDAHLDTWGDYFGAAYTHGTPFRRASEEGLLDPESCLHVGIRGPLHGPGDLADDRTLGFQLVTAIECAELKTAAVVEKIRARIGDRPVYVSVDIDVLDPAFAPGTGTPESGGLLSRELLAYLRGLVGANVIGADVVEVAPAYDHAEITGFAAAHVAYELLSVLSRQRTATN